MRLVILAPLLRAGGSHRRCTSTCHHLHCQPRAASSRGMAACAAPDAAATAAASVDGWRSLGAGPRELRLDFTLPTGQSFRWRQTGPDEYTGVVNGRVVRLAQADGDVLYRVLARRPGLAPCGDAAALADYFQLGTPLGELAAGWAASDARFRTLAQYFPGARVLRQDPVECLFQFVCSSNNHISRIQGMVERLCAAYGTPLPLPASVAVGAAPPASQEAIFHAFPTLEQLGKATEEELRAAGFGYRARFITGSVAQLLTQPGGGKAWLHGLRSVPYLDALEALTALPGVGPKVAACVCLFSLDKAAAIPVDTHVWQLAVRHYTPHLKGKSLTKAVMAAVEAALQQRFGPYAGWAHNTLFIAELASQQHRLPPHLQAPGARAPKQSAAGVGAPAPASPTGDEREAAPATAIQAATGRPSGRGARAKRRRADRFTEAEEEGAGVVKAVVKEEERVISEAVEQAVAAAAAEERGCSVRDLSQVQAPTASLSRGGPAADTYGRQERKQPLLKERGGLLNAGSGSSLKDWRRRKLPS